MAFRRQVVQVALELLEAVCRRRRVVLIAEMVRVESAGRVLQIE